jgi:hypothetical protein
MVSISDRKKAATHWNCGVGIRCQILFRFYHDGVSLDSAQSLNIVSFFLDMSVPVELYHSS